MNLPYPKSFPTVKETRFLKLVLCNDKDFKSLWNTWKSTYDFDHTDDALLHLFPLVAIRMEKLEMQNDELFAKIQGIYKMAWVKNQRLLAVTKDVVTRCNDLKIPTLFLKGIPLILDIYKDKGARLLGDADFLIQPEQGNRISAMLFQNGWHHRKPWMLDSKNPTESIFRVVKATSFRNNFGVDMDVHWNLFSLTHHTYLKDIFFLKEVSSIGFRNAIWRDAIPTTIDGAPCLRLCNEDLLIHVVIHGSEGNNHRTLRWVTDAVTIIKSSNIDWDKIIQRAKDFNFIIELSIAFRYLSENFPGPIPSSFITALQAYPITKRDIKNYYTFTNITHTDRYTPLGNFPLLWYGYWKYETNRSVIGFFSYIKKSFGVTTTKDFFAFVLNKYIARIKKLFPSR